MRFFRRKKREPNDADKAVEDSAEELEKVKEQWSKVNEVTRNMREFSDKNHFADLINEAWGVRKRGQH